LTIKYFIKYQLSNKSDNNVKKKNDDMYTNYVHLGAATPLDSVKVNKQN